MLNMALIMSLTLKKLRGHIAMGLSIRLFVRPFKKIKLGSLQFSQMDSSICVYFSLNYLLYGVMPLLKGQN